MGPTLTPIVYATYRSLPLYPIDSCIDSVVIDPIDSC